MDPGPSFLVHLSMESMESMESMDSMESMESNHRWVLPLGPSTWALAQVPVGPGVAASLR